MAINTYECLFLLDPNKMSADAAGVTGRVNGILEQFGATIVHTQPWGEPKLAYPIRRFKKGSYVLTYFHCESTAIPKIEAECKLNDDVILRHMVLKLHPVIAKEVLAHLEGRSEEESARTDTAAETAAATAPASR